MVRLKTRKSIWEEELERLSSSIMSIFKLESDREFAEKIALEMVERVRSGQKVYVTDRAAKAFAPILEKYGIVLVPTEKVEYPHILVYLPSENTIPIIFKDQDRREIKREIPLKIFIEYLEKALKKYLEETNKKIRYRYCKYYTLHQIT